MHRHNGILLTIIMAALLLSAVEAEFSARVHADRIGLDDPLILTLTLSGTDAGSTPDLSALEDFTIESRSRSTEIRLVNGVSSRLTRFQYTLVPERLGRLRIPAITYSQGGHTLKTAPITVEVVSGSVAPPPRGRSAFQDDFFSSPLSRVRRPRPVDIRLETRLSENKVITGQQVMFEIFLLTQNSVDAANLLSKPPMPGFWQEWFPVPRSSEGNEYSLDGKTYTAFSIRRLALFPLQSGSLTIPSLRFEVVLGDREIGFFSSPRRITRSTRPVVIEVTDPPAIAEGLPIGDYSFSIDPVPATVGIRDMLGLKVKIRGDGNMKTLKIPTLQAGPFIQVFPPRIQREPDHSGDRLRSTVTAEIPIAFRKSGRVSLPPMVFRWYSPREAKVKEVESPLISVQVTGEKSRPGDHESKPGAEVVRRGEDIQYIRTGAVIDQSRQWHGTQLFHWLLVFPFGVSLIVFLHRTLWAPWIRRSRRLQAKRALAAALRSLKALKDLSGAAAVIEKYLQDRMDLAPSRLNSANIAEALERRGVGEGDIQLFMGLKEKADQLRFSPGDSVGADTDEVRRLRELIRKMDKRIS